MTTEHHTQAGALQLRSVTKIYDAKQGQHRAVDSINLDIEAGKFVTFLLWEDHDPAYDRRI